MNVGVVGATGLVGEVFLTLLSERNFPVDELRLFASEQSAGETRIFKGKPIEVRKLDDECFRGLDLVFFSSGDDVSREWAPRAVKQGAFAVDNSNAFRMDPEVALIVPEVNGDLLSVIQKPSLIANPNCSTIQLVVALAPLQKEFGLQAVRVASYQSVSGAGKLGAQELRDQIKHHDEEKTAPKPAVFPYPIAFNCLPQIGSIGDEGFCTEEMKIRRETRKILNLKELPVSAFTVRTPTLNCHSEATWVTLQSTVSQEQVHRCLENSPGLVLAKDWSQYPTARECEGEDPVFVGRIHRDLDDEHTWMMWIVSDNLRKGAALNGLQIAEMLLACGKLH